MNIKISFIVCASILAACGGSSVYQNDIYVSSPDGSTEPVIYESPTYDVVPTLDSGLVNNTQDAGSDVLVNNEASTNNGVGGFNGSGGSSNIVGTGGFLGVVVINAGGSNTNITFSNVGGSTTMDAGGSFVDAGGSFQNAGGSIVINTANAGGSAANSGGSAASSAGGSSANSGGSSAVNTANAGGSAGSTAGTGGHNRTGGQMNVGGSTQNVGGSSIQSDSGVEGGVCTPKSGSTGTCLDGCKDGSESDTDCGGVGITSCVLCGAGKHCNGDYDCEGMCRLTFVGSSLQNVCTDASGCHNGVLDGNETRIDCGGYDCKPCN